jgi:hypothetical protein
MPVEQRLLVGGREVAVVRDALIVIVRDEIEDILFEVRAGAADGVDFPHADHLRERDAQLRGAHRPSDSHEHHAATVEMRTVASRRVFERGGIKMAKVPRDEGRNRAGVRRSLFCHGRD